MFRLAIRACRMATSPQFHPSFQSRLISSTKQTIPIIYIDSDGKERKVQAIVGKHLLDVAHDNDIELEGTNAPGTFTAAQRVRLDCFLLFSHTHTNFIAKGACGGELACATCHLIFEQAMYDTLPAKEPEEDDMLDLAFELTET